MEIVQQNRPRLTADCGQKGAGMAEKEKIAGTSRQAEEAYLENTLAVVRNNVESYGAQVRQMQADIDEMLEHFHDNDVEVLTILNNTVTMHDHMKRALERNEKALTKPYFGRIVFHDEAQDRDESLYIGRGGIFRDTTHWVVVDWRAPVANAYYENGLGKCSYAAPDGKQLEIDLQLKRTYEIEKGQLLDYFDSEVIANDDLLTKYLAKNKQAVLGEIVATIQKEQNEIIRRSPYHNIIVQGVAGSGKTTVAMHRISFILYNYQERFRPDDFYIVGSNRILLNYITGVLPDLDVYGVRQMTMEQLFVRLLYEDWDEKKYRIRPAASSGGRESVKGSLSWFRDLEEFCRRLEWETIDRRSVFLDPRQFVEGFRDGKTGVFDETGGVPSDPQTLVRLADGEAVERYIRQNPGVSVQSKIDMLNERLLNKVREEFLGKGVKYTEAERKAILKAFRGRYGGRVWKRSIYALYQDFLASQIRKGYDVHIPKDAFDVYDLAALAYLYKRIKETEVISEAHHVVIDEAQDFGMMAYCVLKFCIRGCTYTVMGDVSQNIRFGCGLNDWEELQELLLSEDEAAGFCVLKKSYRNTVEISEFASRILRHGRYAVYPAEPIIRHGEAVTVDRVREEEMAERAAGLCRDWQAKGHGTIAVICRDQAGADRAAERLGALIGVMESDPEKMDFGNGIMVLPVELTKGLEFDAVLIWDPTREAYPADDGHAKLLYVAATRALHELCVLYTGELTGLIADPVSEADGARAERQDGTGMLRRDGAGVRQQDEAGMPRRDEAGVRQQNEAGAPRQSTRQISSAEMRERIPAGPVKPAAPAAAEGRPLHRPAARPVLRQGKQPGVGTPEPKAGEDRPEAGEKRPKVERQSPSVSYLNHSASHPYPSAPNPQPSAQRPRTPAPESALQFGDMPSTESLRPAGHARIDLSVRWATKEADGLYLQSRYGVLRISPVGSGIVRVTFVRGGEIGDRTHPGIAVRRIEKAWTYKNTGSALELSTQELRLRVEKSTGAIHYLTPEGKLLLAERDRECRQMEPGTGRNRKNWLFLNWTKGENLYAPAAKERDWLPLKGTARCISHGGGAKGLPLLVSDRGYGILLAADGPAVCCDIPAYGSYLYTESPQMDFYFLVGKRPATVLNAAAYLCGRMEK